MLVDFNLGQKNETLTHPLPLMEESIIVSIQKLSIIKTKM